MSTAAHRRPKRFNLPWRRPPVQEKAPVSTIDQLRARLCRRQIPFAVVAAIGAVALLLRLRATRKKATRTKCKDVNDGVETDHGVVPAERKVSTTPGLPEIHGAGEHEIFSMPQIRTCRPAAYVETVPSEILTQHRHLPRTFSIDNKLCSPLVGIPESLNMDQSHNSRPRRNSWPFPSHAHESSQYEGVDVSLTDFSFQRPKLLRRGSKGSCCSCDSSNHDGSIDITGSMAPYLTIYYATQSGTAELYAKQLHQEGQGMGFDIGLCNVSQVVEALSEEKSIEDGLHRLMIPHVTKSGKKRGRAVFLISTYHDGGPPDDAKEFLGIMQKMQQHRLLKGLRYAVFGFGDSTFKSTFNMQGKLYDHILEDAGAKRLIPVCLGDDSTDLDFQFEHWKWTAFWPKFAVLSAKDCQVLQNDCDAGQPTKQETKTEPSIRRRGSLLEEEMGTDYVLQYVDVSKVRQCSDVLGKIHASARHLVKGVDCHVKDVRSLSGHPRLDERFRPEGGTTMHMELDLSESPGTTAFKYSTGDNIAVMPVNEQCIVEAVAQQLGYRLDASFLLRPIEGKDASTFEPPVPTPCTVQEYLSRYCELKIPPRRSVLRALSEYAEDEAERAALYRISLQSNRREYNTNIVHENIGLADIVTKYYSSIKMKLVDFIGLCAPMQARWYSVSSSSLVYPDSLHITFQVLTIPRTLDDSQCCGLSTHFMANLSAGDSCRIMKMGSSGLTAPLDPTAPLIMVANGTGIAPMRALLQERHFQRTSLNLPVGPTELFFGLRNRDVDFVYSDELEVYERQGILSKLYVTCSQESHSNSPSRYVQSEVEAHADHVWMLLERGAYIYVCGSNKMGFALDKLLRRIVSQQLGPLMVRRYFTNLQQDHRYIRECWSPPSDESTTYDEFSDDDKNLLGALVDE